MPARHREPRPAGDFVAAGRDYSSPYSGRIHRIDPATGVAVAVATPLVMINAVTIERATGDYLVTGKVPDQLRPADVYRVTPTTGAFTLLGTGPLTAPGGGWGRLDGIDLNPDPEAYGQPTPSANSHSWALASNPGGLPTVGNGSFSLTVKSSPAGAPGIWAVSVAPWSPTSPVAGVWINIDVTQIFFHWPLIGMPSETITLPIPYLPALSGIQLFFQTLHVDSMGLGATPGLHVTIL